ncbi:MAG: C-GCAxxG-C-C family protein [Bacteroidota bacterium]
MSKRLKRRAFISRITAATFTGALLGGCINREKDESPESADDPATPALKPNESNFKDQLSENRKLPRELVMKLLDQKVDHYMQLSHHCAQSSFLALKEQFGLEGDEIVKALTPLTGIAERGETCGAVTGPLMVLGLIYGRGESQLNDWETYRTSLSPSGEFCSQFEMEYGSTMCHDIQNVKFGKCFRLTNPEELQEFQEADATEQCSSVVRKAVRIAANIILDDTEIF